VQQLFEASVKSIISCQDCLRCDLGVSTLLMLIQQSQQSVLSQCQVCLC